MSVLRTVEQATAPLQAADQAAGEAVLSAADVVRAADERAGAAVESTSRAIPRPGIIQHTRRAMAYTMLGFNVTAELVARGMITTMAWGLAVIYMPLIPIAPIFAALLTVYLYGL